MYKKLVGTVILMVMFAMFILPTQVKACDAPECAKEESTIPEGVRSYLWESECGTHVHHFIILDFFADYEDFQREVYELHAEMIANNISSCLEELKRRMNERRSELIESIVIITDVNFGLSYNIAPSNSEIQPHIGCCINQNMTAVTVMDKRVLFLDNLDLCFEHNYFDNAVGCLTCGHVERGRVTRTVPGCGLL